MFLTVLFDHPLGGFGQAWHCGVELRDPDDARAVGADVVPVLLGIFWEFPRCDHRRGGQETQVVCLVDHQVLRAIAAAIDDDVGLPSLDLAQLWLQIGDFLGKAENLQLEGGGV